MNDLKQGSIARPPERWQPPGRRWGMGSRSVVPYLSQALSSKLQAMNEAMPGDGPIRNPVFSDMGALVPAGGTPPARR